MCRAMLYRNAAGGGQMVWRGEGESWGCSDGQLSETDYNRVVKDVP